MDHVAFKTKQTAAVYVANGLDESTREAFELHMMGCSDCVEDVEVWREIKLDMPRKTRTIPAYRRTINVFGGWSLAAAFVLTILLGVAGGWVTRAMTGTDFDSAVVFDLPKVQRGTEACSAVTLAPNTRAVVVRMDLSGGIGTIVARGTEKGQLPSSQYHSWVQSDGSQLMQIDAQLLTGRAVHLYARRSDGSEEPVGCITAHEAGAHGP